MNAELVVTDHAWQRWQERVDRDVTPEQIAKRIAGSRILTKEKAGELGFNYKENRIYLRNRRVVIVLTRDEQENRYVMLTVVNLKKSARERRQWN